MTSMIRIFVALLTVLSVSACTTRPAEYRQDASVQASRSTDDNKLSVIASAVIGRPTTYVDQATGLSTEIIVESEYFSANGRICRRFIERGATSDSSQYGLSCNGGNGWVKIPVESFAG